MKTLAITLFIILLFSAINVAFSQTLSNSADQCKTIMHEQIGPKKYPNGTVKLEKSLIPIKVCKSTDELYKKKSKPKPDEPNTDPTCALRTKAQCESLKNWQEQVKKNPLLKVDKALLKDMKLRIDPISIKIQVKGKIGDFKPIDSSGEPLAMPKLTQEQRDAVWEQRKAQAESYQKDLIKFIEENGGKITFRDYGGNRLSVKSPLSVIEKIAERDDVLRISKPIIPQLENIVK